VVANNSAVTTPDSKVVPNNSAVSNETKPADKPADKSITANTTKTVEP